jgi:hypothetical protein
VCNVQDLNPVMSLVHRRCGDTKAAVRRGALQLLEALLVMRASWQVYPRQLPSSADLALLEAATTDPLVSSAINQSINVASVAMRFTEHC